MTTSAAFKIPAAFDAQGRLVVPEEAARGGVYGCPACDARVDLHAGEKKRRHFHHRISTCNPESVVHLTAKLLIARAVEAWLDGGPSVTFERRCAHEDCEATCRQAIPAKVGAVTLEHRLPSGHVADVALLARAAPLPVAVIEVHHTHAVDREKGFEMGVPWIEVDAAQVCDARGRELAVTTDRFLPWFCGEHEDERGRSHRAERAGRGAASALARRLPFRMSEFPGYRIARATRCPNGHDALLFSWDGKEPPWPRPPLVIAVEKDEGWTFGRTTKRPTKTMPWRRAYASACPSCGAVLEDG